MREIEHNQSKVKKFFKNLLAVTPIIAVVIMILAYIAYIARWISSQPVTDSDITIIGSDYKETINRDTTTDELSLNQGPLLNNTLYDEFGNVIRRPIRSNIVNHTDKCDGIYDTSIDVMCHRVISETEVNKIIKKLIDEKGVIERKNLIYEDNGAAFILASQKTGLDPIFLLVLTELCYYNFSTTKDDIDNVPIILQYSYSPDQKFSVLVQNIAEDFLHNHYQTNEARTVFDIGMVQEYVHICPSIRYLMSMDMQTCYDILNGI